MHKKPYFLICVTLLLTACGVQSRIQATPEIHLSRNFGYSSLGSGEIQGNFSIAYSGPATVNRVDFLLDGKPMAETDSEFPYVLKFDTGSYPLGKHTLSAIGYTQDGLEIPAQDVNIKFVAASEGWKAGMKIAIPVLGLVLLVTLVGIGGPILLNRGKKMDLTPGMQRNYGMRGGAICPRCRRPYVLRIFSLNMGLHKLDRCPFCGKWALVRPRSLAELRAAEVAEAAELEQSNLSSQPSATSDEEKIRKNLDDSRYQDM